MAGSKGTGKNPQKDLATLLATAVAHHQQGRVDQAEACYRDILARDPVDAPALGSYAVLAYQTGRTEQAISLLKKATTAHPELGWLHTNLGEIYRSLDRFDEAEACFQQAIARDPKQVVAHLNLGNVLRGKGDREGAVQCYRQALELKSDLPQAHNNLGLTLHELGRHEQAIESLRQALALDPNYVNAHHNLADALRAAGRLQEAIQSLKKAVQADPKTADAYLKLGATHRQHGQFAQAIAALRKALELDGNLAGGHNELGAALQAAGQLDEAVDEFRRALAVDENDNRARYNLGTTLKTMGRLTEAETELRKVVAAHPDDSDAHLSLGNALKDQGRIDEAITAYRAAVRLAPREPVPHSNLLLATNYSNAPGDGDALAAHRRWAQQHVGDAPLKPPRRAAASGPIRIGYVSGDLRTHSVSYFLEPILRHHDRRRVHLTAFADVPQPDQTTARLQDSFDDWYETSAWSDGKLAAAVRAADIDVLVDLAGHTAHSRLRAFAQRPAPVQLSYLGYPNTTGLAAMDGRITDDWADPKPAADEWYTEQLCRLSGGFLCYGPPTACPQVAPLPARNNGWVTFGSFNALPKLNAELISTWAQILAATAGSRLLLKCPSLADEQVCRRYLAHFAAAGIEAERIQCQGFIEQQAEHLARYADIDIGLDPFPYNGVTTTCEAAWMGVPVVNLIGERHAGRVGFSLYNQLGLTELCAPSREAYVATATALAADLDRLAKLRDGLRDRVRHSPLYDGERLARGLEDLYERLLSQVDRAAPTAGNGDGDELRLHIGGRQAKTGWKLLNIQAGPGVDYVGDCQDLSAFGNGSITEIYASHVLEHLDYRKQLPRTLRELHRVLKPGGKLLISVPDLDAIARLLCRAEFSVQQRFELMRMICGGQVDEHDFHKVALSWELFRLWLREAGFYAVTRTDEFELFDDTSSYRFAGQPISLNVIAQK